MTTLPQITSDTVLIGLFFATVALLLFGLVIVYITLCWAQKILAISQGMYGAAADPEPTVLGRHGFVAVTIANEYGLPYEVKSAIRLALAQERAATIAGMKETP